MSLRNNMKRFTKRQRRWRRDDRGDNDATSEVRRKGRDGGCGDDYDVNDGIAGGMFSANISRTTPKRDYHLFAHQLNVHSSS